MRYRRGRYDHKNQVWVPLEAGLPKNPYNGKPILLVPHRYLRDLPTINADDFWDYCCVNENELLRNEVSYDISRRVSKHEIIELARRHPEVRRAYLDHVEKRPGQPYNFHRDRKGLVVWYDATWAYCEQHGLPLRIASEDEFVLAVKKMVTEFRHFVEQNAGWRLLWNDNGTSRSEMAAQLLLLGIVKHYCRANGIDISREADIGRGAVDFKVAAGHNLRVLLELKLARNARFWSGLKKQLPAYLQAEGVHNGYFIVIAYNENDLKKVNRLKAIVRSTAKSLGYVIHTVVVDAGEDKPSASTL